MIVTDNIYSPVFVVFFLIFVGCLIGKLKIKNISFDMVGVLIAAICFGMISNEIGVFYKFESEAKFLSSFGTALFIATVGISSGREVLHKKINAFIYFFFGVLIVSANLLIVWLLCATSEDKSELLGAFCGAMTSTPGLAALCEETEINSISATIGYGQSYLFGVMGIVIFVQIMSQTQNNERAYKAKPFEFGADALKEILIVAIAIVFGYLLGNIDILKIGFTLGNTGGILCSGILIGMICTEKNIITSSNMNQYRFLGLFLFFIGTGIPAGAKLLSNFDLTSIIYGVFLTIIPLVLGYIVVRFRIKDPTTALSLMCGIMTSTPAFGVLLRKNEAVDNSAYTLSYLGALLTIVIGIRFVI